MSPNPRSTRQPVKAEDLERRKVKTDPAAGELIRYVVYNIYINKAAWINRCHWIPFSKNYEN